MKAYCFKMKHRALEKLLFNVKFGEDQTCSFSAKTEEGFILSTVIFVEGQFNLYPKIRDHLSFTSQIQTQFLDMH